MNESKEVLNDLKQESNTNQNIPGPGQGLPTKVSIKKSGSTGQVKIEFYSDEELNEIIGKIIT